MAHTKLPLLSSIALLIALLLVHVQAQNPGLQLTYCSPENTNPDSEAYFWTWQSNGWCFDKCKGDYAFAVVQNQDCWCSNYAPSEQKNIDDCDKTCPGYKTERCGSQDGKLFGYVALQKRPSGTKGASAPTSAKVSPSSALAPSFSPSPTSSQSSTSVLQSSSEVKPTEATKDPSTSPKPTNIPDGSHETAEVTKITGPGGEVSEVTKTIIVKPSSNPSLQQTQSKGSNVGAIVGGVLGGIALLAAIVGAVLFLLWRRRRQQEVEDGQFGVKRNTSTMSKSGLLRTTEKSPQFPPNIVTNVKRNSRMMDGDSISPISGSERRNSRPYLFDQRLNPSAIMTMDNASRGSFVSMDDSRDYGRTLNVRNPDPDPS